MSGVWKRVALRCTRRHVSNLLLCGLAAAVVACALTNTASAIHRRGRIAYGVVAGADVVAYDRFGGAAPGAGYNPVGFGFGGYNYGGYPLYGYAQYLPAAYDGFGAVGYTPTVAVGLPGGYGSGGAMMNAGYATAAAPYGVSYAPGNVAPPCPAPGMMTRGAYRRYMRRMCRTMMRLSWAYLPVPVPPLDCYEGLLGEATGAEEVEEIRAGAQPIEEVRPGTNSSDEPMPEGARGRNSALSIDSLRPETLETPTAIEDEPSLRWLLERDL